jgi:trehalose 6-phosphate phosphatase
MKNILSQANREILEQFAWSNVLLAFDYDGTLAPIVADPKRAVMRPVTADLLREVTKRYPVVVISGRSQADAQRLLSGVEVLGVVGNHGVEPWQTTDRFAAQVARWRTLLDERLASLKGALIEDKTYSLAIHYRHCRQKKIARVTILEAIQSLGDVRVIGGKLVINILPVGAPHKGMALERERDRLHCDTAIYVGDDETDEDVFALDQPGRLLSVRVGAKRTSAAGFCLAGQGEIDSLLRALIGVRRSAERRRRVAQ